MVLEPEEPQLSVAIGSAKVTTAPQLFESFDAVIDNECIYCADYETAKDIYNEAWRVTKYNGKLYSRTFASGSWGDGYRSILVIIAGFVQKGH